MALKLVQGDTGPQIKATITRDDTGELVDLSDATTRLKFRRRGSGTVLFTLTAEAVEDLATGDAIFVPGAGDLNLPPGNYEAEIEVTFNSGVVETVYELLTFELREDM